MYLELYGSYIIVVSALLGSVLFNILVLVESFWLGFYYIRVLKLSVYAGPNNYIISLKIRYI